MEQLILIDDQKSVVQAAVNMLSMSKIFKVDGMTDPFEFLRRVESNGYSGSIIDLKMPFELDGTKLISIVRNIKPGFPIIVLTAFANKPKYQKFLRDGMCDLLIEKPFPLQFSDDYSELIDKMKRLTEQYSKDHRHTDPLRDARYVAKIRNVAVAASDDESELISMVKELNIHSENILVEDTKEEKKAMVFRRPLRILK